MNDEKMLEKIRAKFGEPKKLDERAELEKLFGKSKSQEEESKLRRKIVTPLLKIGDILDVNIGKISYGGDGIARYKSATIFVPHTVPGDAVKVKIFKEKQGLFYGQLIELLAKSSNRIPPRCPYFNDCGGCQLQNLSYTAQLKAKNEMVNDLIKTVGQSNSSVRSIMRSPEPYGYRTRVQLKLGYDNNQLSIGFFSSKSHRLVRIDQCPLVAPQINDLIQKLYEYLPAPHTAPIPQEIIIHGSNDLSEIALALKGSEHFVYAQKLYENLKDDGIPITGIFLIPENTSIGNPFVIHKIRELQFKTHVTNFFQNNRFLISKMLDQVIMLSSPSSKDNLLELFSGVGLFTCSLSKFLNSALGLEGDDQAVDCANQNININSLKNLTFVTSDQKNFLEHSQTVNNPNFLLVDPPRAGLQPNLLKRIIEYQFPKLLYISCNPSTFARDMAMLEKHDYRCRAIQPLDLYPHTYHIETVAFFTHRYTSVQAASTVFKDFR